MKYHIDWHHPSGQVQALPRPQVCHVGLQTSEALQVGGSFQTVTSLNALNNHSNNLPFLSFTFATPVSRHSFLAQYDIYNVATGRSASWNLEGKDSIPSHGFFYKKGIWMKRRFYYWCAGGSSSSPTWMSWSSNWVAPLPLPYPEDRWFGFNLHPLQKPHPFLSHRLPLNYL